MMTHNICTRHHQVSDANWDKSEIGIFHLDVPTNFKIKFKNQSPIVINAILLYFQLHLNIEL